MTTTDRGSSVILPEVKNVGSIAGRALSDGRQLLNTKRFTVRSGSEGHNERNCR